jgi:diguanylate cyclase
MTRVSLLDPYLPSVGAPEGGLEALVRRDQLTAVRRGILIAIPVNGLLAVAITLVAFRHGDCAAGSIWFAANMVVSICRVAHCFGPFSSASDENLSSPNSLPSSKDPVEKTLRLFWISSFASGLVWSLISALCGGYTTPQTLFYLTVVCGTTAGAVTCGTAYARVPMAFITPPLLTVVCCLFYNGGFDRNCLAATVLLYLAALIWIARQSEESFRKTSRIKNEAMAISESLRVAHAHSVIVARQMAHRASHDELTGLLNRAGFMQEVDGYASIEHSTFGLLLLDLDGFKSVNDVFGHIAGDRVLAEVARRLREMLNDKFTIARIGGDEFAIFYDSQASDDSPEVLATRLITAIEVPFASFDAGRLGASIGIYVSSDLNIAEMLTCADEALYTAKSSGRNRYYLFDDTLRRHLDMRRDIERDLQRALSNNALEVWYQPIFGIDGKKLVNFEALLRWKHPTHGWIPPEDLVSTAAMAGLSDQLMTFIFDEVCGLIQTLRRLDLGHVWVAMNVSPREVSRIAIDDFVLKRLDERGLPANMLEIEITEETAMDIRSVRDKLRRLSFAGVRIAIDDFGAGYSSLSSLRSLQLDRIKIDRCFVTGIAESSSDEILVQTILKLGRSFGIEVVAEGVQTVESLNLLQKLGCEFVQGYYLARPAPQPEVVDWLRHLDSRALIDDHK